MFPPVAKLSDPVEELITPSSQSPRDSTPPPDLEGNNVISIPLVQIVLTAKYL